jgi:hypothetical protein
MRKTKLLQKDPKRAIAPQRTRKDGAKKIWPNIVTTHEDNVMKLIV